MQKTILELRLALDDKLRAADIVYLLSLVLAGSEDELIKLGLLSKLEGCFLTSATIRDRADNE